MNSQNIKHVPINKQGCLELGLSPCLVCQTGFACYVGVSSVGFPSHSSCHDDCSEWKTFCDKELMKGMKIHE